MIYQSDSMTLNCIQIVGQNDINDVLICEDIASQQKIRYVVIVLKSHIFTKKYIEMCDSAEGVFGDFMVDSFSYKGQYILVFPYIKKRPLFDFYMGYAMSLVECEDVCSNFVLACIQSGIPYPLLYLILKQKQINVASDLAVYLSFEIDLSELDINITETDCVLECARLLITLLEPKSQQKAISYTLLQKRIRSGGYSRFTELYKDITISASPRSKIGIVRRIKAFWERWKDTVFKFLLVLCIIFTVMVLAFLASQIIFGEVPWIRILVNHFKVIGTENLVQ